MASGGKAETTLNLGKPEDARKFFREYRGIDDKPITDFFELGTGQTRNVLLLNDREICEKAIYFYQSQYAKGIGYFIKEELH